MRPRVFPAEDERTGKVGGGGGVASMRPRVFPAEDVRMLEGDDRLLNELQ